jgi:hypothetical protein
LDWDFGTDYNPVVLEVSAYEALETRNGKNMIVKPIEVKDLEEPILLKMPVDAGESLTCAYLDEVARQWKALNCPQEHFTDSVATCCTTHLSKFALVRTEYLDVVSGNAKAVEVEAFSTANIVGCLIGFVILIVAVGCTTRQLHVLNNERKHYQKLKLQVLHSSQCIDTERKELTIFADDVKPTPRNDEPAIHTDHGMLNAPDTQMRTEE